MPEDNPESILAPGRRQVVAAWLAAAVLLALCLLLVDPGGPLAPVGSSYWKMPEALRLYAHQPPGRQTGLFLLYLLATALIGSLAILCCLGWRDQGGGRDAATALMFMPVAGFLPGYLILIGLNRLLTLLLSNAVAQAVLPWLYVLLAGLLAAACRPQLAGLRWRPVLAGSAWAGLLFALFLVFQVQTDNGIHVLGDGLKRFLPLLRDGAGLAAAAHFPIFLQHYDEVMFLYPFLGAGGRDGGFVELYWLLYAFGKTAALLLSVTVIRLLAGSMAAALLVAAMLFFGAGHLFIGNHLLLFDSGNPLRQNLHVGRVFLAVLPLLMLGLAWSGRVRLRRDHRAALPLLAATGFGMAALSSSVLVLLLSIFACLAARRLVVPPEAVRRALAVLFAALAIAYAGLESALVPWLFLAGIVLAAGICLRAAGGGLAACRGSPGWPPDLPGLAALCAGLFAGLLLAGNSMAAPLLGLLDIGSVRTILPALHAIPAFRIGNNPNCTLDVFGHCRHLLAFAEHFGLALGLPLLAIGLRRRHGDAQREADPVLLLVACMLFLALGFFAYDFTNAGVERWLPAWLKSRLIEPWVYAALAFALVSLWSSGRPWLRSLLPVFVGWQVLAYALAATPPLHRLFLRNLSYLLALPV